MFPDGYQHSWNIISELPKADDRGFIEAIIIQPASYDNVQDELAANLFRLTQTELKLKNESIQGQRAAETIASKVGQRVRKAMLDISGVKPEDMPLHEDINKVKTSLKQTHRGLKKIDD